MVLKLYLQLLKRLNCGHVLCHIKHTFFTNPRFCVRRMFGTSKVHEWCINMSIIHWQFSWITHLLLPFAWQLLKALTLKSFIQNCSLLNAGLCFRQGQTFSSHYNALQCKKAQVKCLFLAICYKGVYKNEISVI